MEASMPYTTAVAIAAVRNHVTSRMPKMSWWSSFCPWIMMLWLSSITHLFQEKNLSSKLCNMDTPIMKMCHVGHLLEIHVWCTCHMYLFSIFLSPASSPWQWVMAGNRYFEGLEQQPFFLFCIFLCSLSNWVYSIFSASMLPFLNSLIYYIFGKFLYTSSVIHF